VELVATIETVKRDFKAEGRNYLDVKIVKECLGDGYEFEEDGQMYRQIYLESYDSLKSFVDSEGEFEDEDIDEFISGINASLEPINALVSIGDGDVFIWQRLKGGE
jgi:hypothetical protein